MLNPDMDYGKIDSVNLSLWDSHFLTHLSCSKLSRLTLNHLRETSLDFMYRVRLQIVVIFSNLE